MEQVAQAAKSTSDVRRDACVLVDSLARSCMLSLEHQTRSEPPVSLFELIACSRQEWSCTLWRMVTHFAEGGPFWYAPPQILGSVLQISVQVTVVTVRRSTEVSPSRRDLNWLRLPAQRSDALSSLCRKGAGLRPFVSTLRGSTNNMHTPSARFSVTV